MAAMKQILQRDFGFRDDVSLVNSMDYFGNANCLFLHGLLDSHQGTCANLPVLYAAVGRRLGYPVKLVSTKSHLFLRWDKPGDERFNIECTGEGFLSDPDEYYMQWPFPMTKDEAENFQFLRSKSPKEELSFFLAHRGHCFHDNGLWDQATEAYACAADLQPANALARSAFTRCLKEWRKNLRPDWPPHFPSMTVHFPPRRFQKIPRELEREILELKLVDGLLHNPNFKERWWDLSRHGYRSPDFPRHVTASFPNGDWKTINIHFHQDASPKPHDQEN